MTDEEQARYLQQLNDPSSPARNLADLGYRAYQGLEDTAAAFPVIVGWAGKGAQYALDNYAPGLSDPQQVQNQAKMRELTAQNRAGLIAALLGR